MKKNLKHSPHFPFKAYLAGHGIKLAEISNLLNLTTSSVSQKNNGYQNYTITEVNKICDHYKISAELFRLKKVS